MSEVALLVELRLLQTEGVDDVDDLLGGIVDVVAGFFRGGVGTDVDGLAADGDLLAVGFVDGAVDFLDAVGVGDELVAGEDVLGGKVLGNLR